MAVLGSLVSYTSRPFGREC